MSVFHENMLIGASGQGAAGPTAGRSVRFNSADSAYLSKVFPSIATNQKLTFSVWCKRSKLGTDQSLLSTNRSNTTNIDFITSNALRIYTGDGAGTGSFDWTTTQLFRDASAWYHIVVAWDTTQSTATNRLKVYVNGQEITSWSSQGTITQNMQLGFSSATPLIGNGIASGYGDFYLALIHLIDGQQLTPSSFGETSATTGQWIAKTYSGTYGANGFFLDFADNSTAAALGYDAAGSNDWTVNNLSVTAGSGNDSLRDHPTSAGTSTGVGGEVSGNYCTLNPLQNSTAHVLSDGNLRITGVVGYGATAGTIGMSSGKWYWEQTLTAVTSPDINLGIGNRDTPLDNFPGRSARSYGFSSNNLKWNNNSNASYTTGWVNGNIIGLAFDADAGTLTLYKNGVSLGVAFSGIPADTYFPMAAAYGTGSISNLNFGQRAFAYTAPLGFSPLVDTLLPTPTIAKPNTVMDTVLYSANGSTQTISGLNFSPDLVWSKSRNRAYPHGLHDSVRGAYKYIRSSGTNAETDTSGNSATYTLTSFNSDGFSVGADGGAGVINNNAAGATTYAAWCWDAGSSNATNTSGTITSTVRANVSAGFSVVSYTGNATSGATVGHGLGGVAPRFIIIKNRDVSDNWRVGHSSLASWDYWLKLNSIDAENSGSGIFNSSAPTSSVFTLGNDSSVNGSGNKCIAYCFAPVSGYSSFGSYTGNGSSDGPFVYTGFRPAVVLVKMSSSTGNWTILDDKREGYNVDNDPLYPNLSNAEGTTDLIDITSNGFKVRTTDATFNTNAGTYIYAAWASAPFPYARAR